MCFRPPFSFRGVARGFLLKLSLPADYPRSPPRAEAALPAPFELQWPADRGSGQAHHSLQAAIQQFHTALARHQLFWDMLDDIDSHAWARARRLRGTAPAPERP